MRLLQISNGCAFQSTLPRGSDACLYSFLIRASISIHAPSRERQQCVCLPDRIRHFNPRSLAGATGSVFNFFKKNWISIHAPSRERPRSYRPFRSGKRFQSTLPRGSDQSMLPHGIDRGNFNPRSLAGATYGYGGKANVGTISIHAPSRERRQWR